MFERFKIVREGFDTTSKLLHLGLRSLGDEGDDNDATGDEAGVLLAQIELSVTGPSTAGQTGTGVLYGGGDSSEEAFTMTVQELDGTAVTDCAVIDLELNASYQITYQVTASGGSASASAWCRGWYE